MKKQPNTRKGKGVQNVTPHARARKSKKTAKGEVRSVQVATALVEGKSSSQIAKEIGVTERQVKRIKKDEDTQITFAALLERKREDLLELWDETVDGARQGIKADTVIAVEVLGEGNGEGEPEKEFVTIADHRTRQLAIRNSITLYQMIFNQKRDDGPMTITLENARELLNALRAQQGPLKK